MNRICIIISLVIGLFLTISCNNDSVYNDPDLWNEKNVVLWAGDTLEVSCARFAGTLTQDVESPDETSIVLWLDNGGHNICWVTCKNDDLGKLIKLNGAGENYEIYLDVNDKRQSWHRRNHDEAFGMGEDSYIKINRNSDKTYSIEVRKSTPTTLYVYYKGLVENSK